jgi:hypothetical protein
MNSVTARLGANSPELHGTNARAFEARPCKGVRDQSPRLEQAPQSSRQQGLYVRRRCFSAVARRMPFDRQCASPRSPRGENSNPRGQFCPASRLTCGRIALGMYSPRGSSRIQLVFLLGRVSWATIQKKDPPRSSSRRLRPFCRRRPWRLGWAQEPPPALRKKIGPRPDMRPRSG